MKFTRMDWYPWDFDEDEYVKLLPWSQQNAYMRILTIMWKWADKHDAVDLPDDDFRIAGAIGISLEEWAPLRERLVDHPAAPLKHDHENRVVYSPRMREEYAKALDRRAVYSTAPPAEMQKMRKEWDRVRGYLAPEIFVRDGFCCRQCGAIQGLEIDHVVPIARGGTNVPSNLQTLCRTCNSRKGSRI